MSKVIEFHKKPKPGNSNKQLCRDLMADGAKDIESDKFGNVVFAAVVYVTSDNDVVTQYAGNAHTFQCMGALQHMSNRVANENNDNKCAAGWDDTDV